MIERTLLREYRKQNTIKQRLAEAKARTGFSLPARVPVTLETLLEVKQQLEDHLAKNQAAPGTTLN